MEFVSVTIGGRYLRLCEVGGQTRMSADGRSLEASAIFQRIELGHGRIALCTLDGRFLTMRPEPQTFALVPEDELSPAAAFEEILWPTGQVSLRSSELTFVGVQERSGGAVTVNRTQPALTERFFFVPVPAAMVPRQRVASEESGQHLPPQRADQPAAGAPS